MKKWTGLMFSEEGGIRVWENEASARSEMISFGDKSAGDTRRRPLTYLAKAVTYLAREQKIRPFLLQGNGAIKM